LEGFRIRPLVAHRRAHRIERAPGERGHVNWPELVREVPGDEEAHLLRSAAGVHSIRVATAEVERCRGWIRQNVERREAVQNTCLLALAHQCASLDCSRRR